MMSSPSPNASDDANSESNHTVEVATNATVNFRRDRSSRACKVCHERKVRCDVMVKSPCSNCVDFGCKCWIPKRRKRTVKRRAAQQSVDGSAIGKNSRRSRSGTSKSVLIHGYECNGNMSIYISLPAQVRDELISRFDETELTNLRDTGAFTLPPKEIADVLIASYFEKIHPLQPFINKTTFLKQYNDPNDSPSLLLLQAVLMAGTRVCRIDSLLDHKGSMDRASWIMHRRVKRLYDLGYETDNIASIQTMVLLSWCWEGPEDVTKNSFYWTRLAISVAQGIGMHRSVENTTLSIVDKRIWKRIWWVLFSRDRSLSLAYGRPVLIHSSDSDVLMLTELDFVEEEGDGPYEYPPNKLHCEFFIALLQLSEIVDLIYDEQLTVAREYSTIPPDITRADVALRAWKLGLPSELAYSSSKHGFLSGMLHSQYYTLLCLIHRADLSSKKPPRATTTTSHLVCFPSSSVAFMAAHKLAAILETMTLRGELRDAPAAMVYYIFSAAAVLMYALKMNASVSDSLDKTRKAFKACVNALHQIASRWLIARIWLRFVYAVCRNMMVKKPAREETTPQKIVESFVRDHSADYVDPSDVPASNDASSEDNTSADSFEQIDAEIVEDEEPKTDVLWSDFATIDKLLTQLLEDNLDLGLDNIFSMELPNSVAPSASPDTSSANNVTASGVMSRLMDGTTDSRVRSALRAELGGNTDANEQQIASSLCTPVETPSGILLDSASSYVSDPAALMQQGDEESQQLLDDWLDLIAIQ
ncbi:fungal-specific transcription factor domain-containing protein [Limtongia smithiae]|uniref:fungal-specific transcription factor domain-containing protein n=1 Tax=Limtongia smithiae TaxID=1125753 RepID=UPI0034CFD1AD